MSRRAPRKPRTAPRRRPRPRAATLATATRAADVAAAAARAQQADAALTLRIAGASYRTIAQQLQIGLRQAYDLVQAELAELDAVRQDQAERLRDLELARCDRLTQALEPKLAKHDVRAVRAAVAVGQFRADLLGLRPPAETSVTVNADALVALLTQARAVPPTDGAP